MGGEIVFVWLFQGAVGGSILAAVYMTLSKAKWLSRSAIAMAILVGCAVAFPVGRLGYGYLLTTNDAQPTAEQLRPTRQ